MTFADVPDFDDGEREFRRTQFTKIVSGVNTRIRILNKKAHHEHKHFIPNQRVSIRCLGEERCPICQNNQRLIKENPDKTPNQISGFINRQNRYMTNVLNRTLVKVTSDGNVVFPKNGQFPTNDPASGSLITGIEPTPLNRVEVLERGPSLFKQFNNVNSTVADEAGNPIGIWNYDIIITATGKGRKMVTNVMPYSHHNDPIEGDFELYDLEDVSIVLEPDEILKLLGGVSLSDIFSARYNSGESDLEDEAIPAVVDDEVEKSIDDLFAN